MIIYFCAKNYWGNIVIGMNYLTSEETMNNGSLIYFLKLMDPEDKIKADALLGNTDKLINLIHRLLADMLQ